MAVTIVGRAGWNARAPKKPPTHWTVANLDGVVQHWFGKPTAAKTHAGCDDLLRSVQNGHMGPGGLGTKDGGNDIGYNFGVCPHGNIYELRGWHAQTGANGTSDANRRFIAFVYMAGVGDPFTAKAEAALQDLYAEAFKRGIARSVRTHGSITGSECPGPVLTAWVKGGGWKPKPKVRFVLMDGEGKQLDRSVAVVEGPGERTRLKIFLNASVGKLLTELRTDRDAVIRRKPA